MTGIKVISSLKALSVFPTFGILSPLSLETTLVDFPRNRSLNRDRNIYVGPFVTLSHIAQHPLHDFSGCRCG